MYQYISSMSKIINGNKEWVSDNITNNTLETLLTTYSKVILTLSNVFLPANVSVDFLSLLEGYSDLTITLNQFLINNGNNTLPTITTIPSYIEKYAKYVDAFKAGYTITPYNTNKSVTSQDAQSDKNSICLTKDNLDYNLFYNNCLVNVNGFFHMTDTDGKGIYVYNGMTSVFKSKLNNIGIYNFTDIGNIQLVPITSEMIYKQYQTQKYSDYTSINLGIDISNKTVMLVLGGYLHIFDDITFKAINSKAFNIYFNNLPLLDRYFESNKYLDLSSLGLSKSHNNKNQISVKELYSDAVIEKYLTLSQSFFVIIDNENISLTKIPVRNTGLPDMYVSYIKPQDPLVVQSGRIINYWDVFEDGQWSLTCNDSMVPNLIYDTVDALNENSVDNSVISTQPFIEQHPYFLKISSQ